MLSVGGVAELRGSLGLVAVPLLRHLAVFSVEPGSVYFMLAKMNSFEN